MKENQLFEENLKREKKIKNEKKRLEFIRTADARAKTKIHDYEKESKRLSKKLDELVNKQSETEGELVMLRNRGSWGEEVEIKIELVDYLKGTVAAVKHVINERLLVKQLQEEEKVKKKDIKKRNILISAPPTSASNILGSIMKSKTLNVFQAKRFLLKQRLRSNPIVVLVAYDVPGKPRTCIINALLTDFQGEFDYTESSIDDVLVIQEILQRNGRSVILNVNSGLTYQSRDIFIQKVF